MITVNGTYLADYMRINTINRGGIIPPRDIQTLDIPQKIGLYKIGQKTGAREITIGATIIGVSYEEVRKRYETIGDVIRTDDPVPIVFDDEPDRTYYGMLSGATPLDEAAAIGKATLTFICFDPYKYGGEELREFTGGGSLDFLNDTNGDIYPTYEISFNAPATFMSILSDEKQITIGNPASVEQTVVPRDQLIMQELFAGFGNWTATNTAVDLGVVAGEFAIDTPSGGNFVPANFGSGTYDRWHGPALIKSLSEPLDDFKMEVYLENKSTGTKGSQARATQVGRVEIYLLDVNNQVIGKFAVKDPTQHHERTYGEARLGGLSGGLTVMNYAGNGTIWNDFDGRIYVERINNRWSITYGKFDWATRRHHSRLTVTHFDAEQKFAQQVAKIQVHMAAHTNYPPTKMLLDTMRVWKVNEVTRPEIPYIVDAGDVVEIETATGGIYKNGVPWMDELDPTSEFFPLKPGITPLAFYPGENASVAMRYRKRWL